MDSSSDVTMRGFRVTALDSQGNIRDEVGDEKHCFSISLERSRWWAAGIMHESRDMVPRVEEMHRNGLAIIEIEAQCVSPAPFSPSDYYGWITKIVRVVDVQHRAVECARCGSIIPMRSVKCVCGCEDFNMNWIYKPKKTWQRLLFFLFFSLSFFELIIVYCELEKALNPRWFRVRKIVLFIYKNKGENGNLSHRPPVS